MQIATAIVLIAVGAIMRYAVNVDWDVISIPTVGLILMIAGFTGLGISLLYELIRNRPPAAPRDVDAQEQYRDPYEDRTRRLR